MISDECHVPLGGDIGTEFKLNAIRIEPDGFYRLEPELQFACEPICITDVDSAILEKWISKNCENDQHSLFSSFRSYTSIERMVSINSTPILFLLF